MAGTFNILNIGNDIALGMAAFTCTIPEVHRHTRIGPLVGHPVHPVAPVQPVGAGTLNRPGFAGDSIS